MALSPFTLAKDKDLHEIARKLDGKNVILKGRGVSCIEIPPESQDYELCMKFFVTTIRLAGPK